MPCIRAGGALLSVADEYEIAVDGKAWCFEWSPYIGPVVLGKRGEPLRRQPRAVLVAIGLWAEQGRQIKDGRCVWMPDPRGSR